MKVKIYIVFLACFFSVGCNQTPQQQDITPYTISSANMYLESNSQGSTPFPTDGSFGTYVALQEHTMSYVSSNAKWSYNGGYSVWLPADYPSGISANGAANVYAYAPYNATAALIDNMMAVNLPSDQATLEGNYLNSDIVWAHGATSATDTKLNLLFEHKMSKIVINLYAGTRFKKLPDGNNLPPSADISIYYNGLKLKGKMDITNGVVSDQELSDKSPLYPRLIFDENGKQGSGVVGDPKIYECVVVPQTVNTGDVTITLFIEGALYTNELTLAAQEIEPGKVYTVNLTVNESGFDIGLQNVAPWVVNPPDLGSFVRYNYVASVDFAKIIASSVISTTLRSQYRISCESDLIIGDKSDIGAISHEYLYDSRRYDRKVVAEAIVAYAMTPDKKGIDTLNGLVLKVLRKFVPAIDASTIISSTIPSGVVLSDKINGGEVDNLIYTEGNMPPIDKVYFYHNTVLTSADGILYDPFSAVVRDDYISVPVLPVLPALPLP